MLVVGTKVVVDTLLAGLDPLGTEDDSLKKVDGTCAGPTGISCEVCVGPAALDVPEARAGLTEVGASELIIGDAGTVGLKWNLEELVEACCGVEVCAESVWVMLAEATLVDAAWVLDLLVDCEDMALGLVVTSAEDDDEGKL